MKRVLLKIAIGAAFVSLLVFVALYFLTPKPPIGKIEYLQQSLSRARLARAHLYTPDMLAAAEAIHTEAMRQWRQENTEWSFLRNYQTVSDTAQAGLELARRATIRSYAVQDSLNHLIFTQVIAVRQRIRDLRINPAILPSGKTVFSTLVEAELLLKETEIALTRMDYFTAKEKIDRASTTLHQSQNDLDAFVQEYLSQMPKWRQWAAETIAWSERNKTTALVVDKVERRCMVYVAGVLKHSFSVELGPYWIGSKQRQGDRKTPEGKYLVTKKKGHGQTKYYRALEINYPNGDDKNRFQAAKAAGRLPRSARIGNLIEVHGSGGRGDDWTDGCVALRNNEMDVVFKLAGVGTPVTIIGAFERPTTLTSNNNGASEAKRKTLQGG
ncbi:MAG: L,D-transpeptidase family protein [candidate division Zixibacteria bacterium]|nr:L,D-transpeptidase family protein [candidate division Zixibacteria bacterium]